VIALWSISAIDFIKLETLDACSFPASDACPSQVWPSKMLLCDDNQDSSFSPRSARVPESVRERSEWVSSSASGHAIGGGVICAL
jgi:hypothetical protein